jgi:hypothetical protein
MVKSHRAFHFLAALSLAASAAFAASPGIVFWNMSAHPPSYRLLRDGKLTGPFTGTADARGSEGQPPLGTIYYTDDGGSRITVPQKEGTPEFQRGLAEVYAAVGAYNSSQLEDPRVTYHNGSVSTVILNPILDQRTGLLLPKSEVHAANSYGGFAYLQRSDGTWYALNVGYGNDKNPSSLATKIAGETLRSFKRSPAAQVNYRDRAGVCPFPPFAH